MAFDEFVARDEAASARIAEWDNGRYVHAIAWLMARTGDSIFWFLIIALLLWQKRPLGWELLLVAAVTAILTAIIKGIFKRGRPSEKRAISTDKYSFPSGHSARAGAVAVTLSFAFPQFSPLILLWAILVGFSRIVLSRHYLSDVLVGLVFGMITALILHFLMIPPPAIFTQ